MEGFFNGAAKLKKRYRLLVKGNKLYIKKKFLFFFWKTINIFDDFQEGMRWLIENKRHKRNK